MRHGPRPRAYQAGLLESTFGLICQEHFVSNLRFGVSTHLYHDRPLDREHLVEIAAVARDRGLASSRLRSPPSSSMTRSGYRMSAARFPGSCPTERSSSSPSRAVRSRRSEYRCTASAASVGLQLRSAHSRSATSARKGNGRPYQAAVSCEYEDAGAIVPAFSFYISASGWS